MDTSTYWGWWNFSIRRSLLPTKYLGLLTAVFVLVGFAGCSLSGPEFNPEIRPGVFQFDFETGQTSRQGWGLISVGFPVRDMETESNLRSLPEEVQKEGKALYVRTRTSVGMALFFKRRIERLKPTTTYHVGFEVEIASNVGSNCIGTGSSATSIVTAALSIEPKREIERGPSIDTYVLNEPVAKALGLPGPPSTPPKLGTIANGIPCDEAYEMERPYRLKTLESGPDFWTVTTDEEGSAWLLVGMRTVSMGTLDLYYNEITARFEEVEN